MRLPSLKQTFDIAGRTFRRFPLVIIDAIAGTAAGLVLIDYEGPPGPTVLFKILFASILGIPLLISVSLMIEKGRWGRTGAIAGQGIAILLLVAYAFSVPSDLQNAPNIYLIRLLIFAIALHLVVAFSPYIRAGEGGAFWQFNKSLFLRIFTAVLYTCVLYAGLSLALAALNHLFGLDVPVKRYGELWVLLAGIVMTWTFLAGLPDDWEALGGTIDYPKGLRIFAQYILFPLVIVYLVILYAYLAKILIDWDWPKGWVGRLILGFSGVGILSLLLLHPIRESAGHAWVRTTSRWFYVLLIPLTVMLFLALLRRDAQYGMTEGRYVGFACSIWLAAISIYFIVSRKKNIKVIPVSLCVIALLISAGPTGMFSVSEKSQIGRLRVLLETRGMFVNGAARKADTPVPREDAKQISSILQYLREMHGYDGIQPWFSDPLRAATAGGGSSYVAASVVAEKLGIEYVNLWYGGDAEVLMIDADRRAPVDVGGYSHMFSTRHFFANAAPPEINGRRADLRATRELDSLTLVVPGSPRGRDSLAIGLSPLAARLFAAYGVGSVGDVSPDTLSVEASNDVLKAKFFIRHMQLKRVDEKIKILDVELTILYAARP